MTITRSCLRDMASGNLWTHGSLSYSSVASGIVGAAVYVDDTFTLLNLNLMKCTVLVALSSSVGMLFHQKWKKVMTNRRIELLTFRFGIWRATNCASRPYILRKKQQYILHLHKLSKKQCQAVSTFLTVKNYCWETVPFHFMRNTQNAVYHPEFQYG